VTTRLELRHSIATILEGRAFQTATVSALSGNNLRCAGLVHLPADYYNNGEMHVYSGTAIGQSRRIHDCSVESATPPTYYQLNPFVAFSPQAVAADAFEVHRFDGWTVAEYNEAIAQAHRGVEDLFLVDTSSDDAVTLESEVYQYDLAALEPSGWRYINDVRWVWTDDGGRWESLLPTEWTVQDGTLVIDPDAIYNDVDLRIVGQKQATLPTADASDIEVPLAYIVPKAIEILLSMHGGGEYSDPKERQQWVSYWQSQAAQQLTVCRTPVKPNSKAVGNR
jgi:hypothetical protein